MARGRGRPGRTNNQSFENSNMQQSPRTFLKRKIETDEDDKNVFLTPLPLKRQSLGSNGTDCNSEVCKSEVCMNSSDKACSPRKGEFKRCLFGVENGDNWRTRHLRSMGKVTNCLELPNAGRGNAVARKDRHANGSGSNKCGKLCLVDSQPHTCIQMHMVESEVDLSKDELSNAERGNAVAGKDSQANCSGNNKCDKPCLADSPPHTCIQMHMDESEVGFSKDELPKPDQITVPFAENDVTLCIPCSTDKCSSSDRAYPFTPQLESTLLVAEQNGVHSSRSFAENVDNDITTTEVFITGSTDAENPSLSDSGPTTMSSCKSDMTVLEAGNIPGRLEELQYEVEKYSESINVGSVNFSDDHSGASPEKLMSEGCEKGSQEREAVRLTEQEDIIEHKESGCQQICPSNGFQPSEMDSSAEVGQVFALQNFTTAENCQDEKEENKESEGDNTEKAILEPIENCERSEDNESKCNPGSPDLHHTEKAILEPMEHCERSEDNESKCNPGSPDFHHTEKAILEPMERCERSEDNESKCNPESPDFHHTEKAILEPMEHCERSEDSESKCNPGSPDFHQSQPKIQSRPLNADTLSPSTRMLRSQTSKLGVSPTNIATQLESMQREVSVSKNQPLWNSTKVKLKIKMPEKIVLEQVPSTVKLLLLTGLLEGRFVRYVGRGDQVMLTGVIRGPGILCGCSLCKGKTVVSICNFEEHAGSTARHASDFIILDNGRSLRDILEECKGVSVDNFPDVIRKAIDSSNRGFHACRKCRAPIDQSNQGKSSSLCQTCDLPPQIQPKVEITPIVRKRGRPRILDRKVEEKPHVRPRILDRKAEEKPLGRPRILDRKMEEKPLGRPRILDWKVEEKPLGRPRILDRKVEDKPQTKMLTKSSPKVLDVKVREKPAVQSRVLQKDMTLHKIIFKPHGLPDGTKLAYYVKGQRLLDGHKQGFGIFCSCCKTVLSSSQFEAHAGRASRRNPYNSIYLSDGRSLHEVALELADQQGLNDDNEDYCGECGDGGDLVCCDGCPRVFHKECVGLPHVPKGKYYCSYCRHQSGRGRKLSSRKELKTPGKSVGAGPLEKPSNRCTRVVKAPEKTVGGCVLCRREDFEKVGFGDRTVMLCDQCEKEFHVGCLREHNMADLKKLPEDEWFCSNDCKKIHCALQKLVEHGPKTIPKELIKNHTDNGVDEQSNAMINWQLLYGKTRDPEKRALLSKAVAIFSECFDPIIDPVTGRDLIPSMVYSRSIRDQEFGGMYCAVLTVDLMVVSAGVFRVFGGQVAELPLVATSPKFQGQGYFQALFSSIERLLGCLNIENLVLPAAEEAESLWINKFGFTNMSEEQFYTYRKDLQIMSFQGNSMLEKPLISLNSIHARSNKGV